MYTSEKCVQSEQAIAIAVAAQPSVYDSHDVVTYVTPYYNNILNDIIDAYAASSDPVHTATVQLGRYLLYRLGQQKIGERASARHITLTNGTTRDGWCSCSLWRRP